MADYKDIVKLAIDTHGGSVAGNYSTRDTLDALRGALIDANGGSEKLDFRRIRDGKCGELFAIIEEILKVTNEQGLMADSFFNTMVEYKNVAEGDQNKFTLEDTSLFVVSTIANGTQALRKQRLNAGASVTIETARRGIKIYEELDRILSGRVDMNAFINKVGQSFLKKSFDDVYSAFNGITSSTTGLNSTYVLTTGSYSEDTALDLISHVEAATGKSATVFGTKKALRKLVPSIAADLSKMDVYNMGYYGNFNGTPCVAVKQAHNIGTDTFTVDDTKVIVMATGSKPVKYVNEGEPLIITGDVAKNADLTQDFLYTEKYGVGVIATEKFGIYDLA